jgi:hypothetical protein
MFASGWTQDRQPRVLAIAAAMMRPTRQSVMVADQFAIKFNRLVDCYTPLPVIFAVAVK